MKKKILTGLFAFAFLLPCVFLFTACGPKFTNLSVELVEDTYTISNNAITITYGENVQFTTADFSVKVNKSDNTAIDVSAKIQNEDDGYEFASTLPTLTTPTPVGDYTLTFSYPEVEDYVITVHIVKATITDNTQNRTIQYSGNPNCTQELLIEYLDFSNFEATTVVNLAKTIQLSFDEGQNWINFNDVNFDEHSMTNAGVYNLSYKFTFDNYNDIVAHRKITVEKIIAAKPEPSTTVFTYTGDNLTYDIPEHIAYIFSGDARTQKDAGSYNIAIELKDTINYMWNDDTTDRLIYTFVINKATITDNTQNRTVQYSGNPNCTRELLIEYLDISNFEATTVVALAKTIQLSFDEGQNWINFNDVNFDEHSMTDVGEYKLSYKFTFDNYKDIIGHKTITVKAN